MAEKEEKQISHANTLKLRSSNKFKLARFEHFKKCIEIAATGRPNHQTKLQFQHYQGYQGVRNSQVIMADVEKKEKKNNI